MYLEDSIKKHINNWQENIQSNMNLASMIDMYLFQNEPIENINNLDSIIQSISNNKINKFSKKTFTNNFINGSLLPKD